MWQSVTEEVMTPVMATVRTSGRALVLALVLVLVLVLPLVLVLVLVLPPDPVFDPEHKHCFRPPQTSSALLQSVTLQEPLLTVGHFEARWPLNLCQGPQAVSWGHCESLIHVSLVDSYANKANRCCSYSHRRRRQEVALVVYRPLKFWRDRSSL